MSVSEIKLGDVVVLKSGGPAMTVRSIENDEAFCEWFEGNENKGAKFALAQLQAEQDDYDDDDDDYDD